jgi:fatty-acid desaturase
LNKISFIDLLIRFRLIAFSLISTVGLYFLWDPLYLLYSLLAYFLFFSVGHDIGLHRYYTHQSFTCNKFVETILFLLSFLGGMSDPISYAKRHTRHHLYADTEFDNLQPKNHPILTWLGYGVLTAEHVDQDKIQISKKLTNSKFYQFINKNYFFIYYTSLLGFFLIDYKLSFYILLVGATIASHMGGISNVITHRYGHRNFNTNDYSTNNKLYNFISFGHGWHNNHHKFPYAYTNKTKDGEFDLAGWIIKYIFATKVIEPKLK